MQPLNESTAKQANELPLYELIRRYRVFPIFCAGFFIYMEYALFQWIFSLGIDSVEDLNKIGMGAATLIVGLNGTLAITFRFIFQFAMNKPAPEVRFDDVPKTGVP